MAGAGVGGRSLRSLQGMWEMMMKSSGAFDRHCSRVNIVSGGNGNLTAVMRVEKEDCNQGGFLHGGMSALLVDCLSGAALMTHPKCESAGVSININMTYLKAMPVGEDIVIKATTDKLGKRLAFLTVEIIKKSSGEVVVKGSHTKFIG